jgi:hypothetical protein
MARTTITIDDQLLREAKIRAAQEGTTLSVVVSRALLTDLRAEKAATADREPFLIEPLRGGRFQFESELPGAGEMLALVEERERLDTARKSG